MREVDVEVYVWSLLFFFCVALFLLILSTARDTVENFSACLACLIGWCFEVGCLAFKVPF